MDFEWDDAKARSNEKKHGVSFLEATEVFGDKYSSCVHEPEHSNHEERHLVYPQKIATLLYRLPHV